MIEKKSGILELRKNDVLRENVINVLCEYGAIVDDKYIGHSTKIREIFNYVIDHKYNLFDREEFKSPLYEGEDEILELILPSVRRAYGKVFISPPTLLEGNRLELLHLYFDIDIFIDYLIDMLLKNIGTLKNFDNIDRTNETLSLIVDNYVAGLVKRVRECEDHTQEIRDIKIKSVIK
jgi:hypothetical protein